MKMKIMISQPMRGKTDDEICEQKNRITKMVEGMGYDVVNTLFSNPESMKDRLLERGVAQVPIYYLAMSIDAMSLCDAVIFCKGWENYRGCRIEHEVASAYGLKILYEE